MGEQRIALNISKAVLLAEKTDAETFARELRMLAAVKLYEWAASHRDGRRSWQDCRGWSSC